MPIQSRNRRVNNRPYPSRDERLTGVRVRCGDGTNLDETFGKRGTQRLMARGQSLSTIYAYLRQCQHNIETIQGHRIDLTEMTTVANHCFNSPIVQQCILENQYHIQHMELLNTFALNNDIRSLWTAVRLIAENHNDQPRNIIYQLMHYKQALNQVTQHTFQWI